MKEQPYPRTYACIKWLAKTFYPKMEVAGLENMPDEPAVFISNHAKTNGPVSCELYFPREKRIWGIGEMMHTDEIAVYAYKDFWSEKPIGVRWIYKILSYLIVPAAVVIFNTGPGIGVYHDKRIISTIRNTVKALTEGNDIIIFPEHNVYYNGIVYEFQDGFVDVARSYYRKTGKALAFVPMYIAPKLKKMCIGKPTYFDPGAPAEEERKRVCNYLMEEITDIAYSLPEHTVIPYPNIPRRDYPLNIPKEVRTDEERTCC